MVLPRFCCFLFFNFISNLDLRIKKAKLFKWYDESKTKPRCCTRLLFGSEDKITLSIVKNHYICAHFNFAYFPSLDDF